MALIEDDLRNSSIRFDLNCLKNQDSLVVLKMYSDLKQHLPKNHLQRMN